MTKGNDENIMVYKKMQLIIKLTDIPIEELGGKYMQGVVHLEKEEQVSAGDLFMIEEIDAENNILVLANYVFNKKVKANVPDEKIEFYSFAFDEAVRNNMFLFVEYSEREGIILG